VVRKRKGKIIAIKNLEVVLEGKREAKIDQKKRVRISRGFLTGDTGRRRKKTFDTGRGGSARNGVVGKKKKYTNPTRKGLGQGEGPGTGFRSTGK